MGRCGMYTISHKCILCNNIPTTLVGNMWLCYDCKHFHKEYQYEKLKGLRNQIRLYKIMISIQIITLLIIIPSIWIYFYF